MTITRKQFLKLAAASLAGVAGAKLVSGAEVVKEAAAPKSGKRWAMAVDFQKCRWDQGCNQCSAACNRTHNVPDIPDKAHEVKWIWKEKYQTVFRQQSEVSESRAYRLTRCRCSATIVPSPACTKVCPTGATWKQEDGVVMMDWHRCIGCRYCMAACPYGSRSFNFVDPRPYVANINPDFPTRTKGVVEKCNFLQRTAG